MRKPSASCVHRMPIVSKNTAHRASLRERNRQPLYRVGIAREFISLWRVRLTRHKSSDRQPCATNHAAKGWMANTHKVERRLAGGSLHRLVRRHLIDRRWVHSEPETFGNKNRLHSDAEPVGNKM